MRKKRKKKQMYSAIEKKPHGFENPRQFAKRLRRNLRHSYQRVKYGYCDRDVWSIDWWFLNVVPNMLEDLRDTTHSYPVEFANSHNVKKINDKGEPDAGAQKWDAVLREMIHLFREANKETCSMKNPYQNEYDKYLMQNYDLEKGKQHENKEYDALAKLYLEEEAEICEYREKCKNKALALFSKWFWDLWD